jgi:hypothetical protein
VDQSPDVPLVHAELLGADSPGDAGSTLKL